MSNKNRRKRKSNFLCVDCGLDTSKAREHYFIHTDTWTGPIGASIHEMLCIQCVEKRLKRPLCSSDFTTASINDPKRNEMSDRLRNAILRH